ncbi:hypothetical protein BKA64DRAFT_673541 [Cadophora sp. MPI-SDFR-AT-0126]|nr:hypothetical protein BKA64DRAFT_673541 [Leotiomycetes sp. MPI-SDFR-AT-0126]
MSCASSPTRSSFGEETIFAFKDLFVLPRDATQGFTSATDASHCDHMFASGTGSPIYSRAVNIPTNLDLLVNNPTIVEIADWLVEEATEIYSYACYRPADSDWQLFNNSVEIPQLGEADFLSDADACCGSPLSTEISTTSAESGSWEGYMHTGSRYDDYQDRLEDIYRALDDFKVRSLSDYIPAELSRRIHQKTILERWIQNYEHNELIAVKFQQQPSASHTTDTVQYTVPYAVTLHTKAPDTELGTKFQGSDKIEHTAQSLTDTTEEKPEKVLSSGNFEPTVEDVHVSEEIDQFFTSNLVSLKELFISKAIQPLTLSGISESNVAEAAENDTAPPKSNERSNVQSTSFGKHLGSPAPKKRANDESDNDDDYRAGNNKKKQKEAHDANGAADIQRLACPFRKHNPAKFGLGNPRYKTCATGSWKDVGKLKDSHIYRSVHRAQCSGCKKPMRTQLEFRTHQTAAIVTEPKTNCTSCEGLFVQEIESLRKLKVKGLGPQRSWEAIYKILFPNSMPIPNPWWVPPCDNSYQDSDQRELKRRIVAYLEARFQCEYDKIIASKDEILQSLVEMIPERNTMSASPPTDEPAEAPELDNGKGPSMSQWEASLPVQVSNNITNDDETSNSFQDLNPFDFDLYEEHFGATQTSTSLFNVGDDVGGTNLEVNFDDYNPASGSMEVPQLGFDAQCISIKAFLCEVEDVTNGVGDISCQEKGKGIDLGVPINSGPLTGYQEGYQAGFSEGLKQGKDLGYKAGWRKGNISGYNSGMEAVEEGNVQLKAFRSSSVFNGDVIG